MLSRILFYAIWWGLLLLPVALLLFFWRNSLKSPSEDEGGGIAVARWMGLACCLAPVLAATHLFLYDSSKPHTASTMYFFVLVVAVLFALPAACLFAINARSSERFTGPIACIIAAVMSFVVFFGGTATA